MGGSIGSECENPKFPEVLADKGELCVCVCVFFEGLSTPKNMPMFLCFCLSTLRCMPPCIVDGHKPFSPVHRIGITLISYIRSIQAFIPSIPRTGKWYRFDFRFGRGLHSNM